MKKTKIIQIGVIGVDAGLCWIGDPCYIHPDNIHGNNYPHDLGRTWEEFCDKLRDQRFGTQFNYNKGHEGLGVCVSTGFGDGSYPVFAEISDEGDFGKRVKKVWIEFISDENERSIPR